MLLDSIPLAGISRVTKVSEKWLQDYVNSLYNKVPQHLEVNSKPPVNLIIQCDEDRSFVGNKGNKQWIWLALDAKTRVVVGIYIGDRSRESALKLWSSLPAVYPSMRCMLYKFWGCLSNSYSSNMS